MRGDTGVTRYFAHHVCPSLVPTRARAQQRMLEYAPATGTYRAYAFGKKQRPVQNMQVVYAYYTLRITPTSTCRHDVYTRMEYMFTQNVEHPISRVRSRSE